VEAQRGVLVLEDPGGVGVVVRAEVLGPVEDDGCVVDVAVGKLLHDPRVVLPDGGPGEPGAGTVDGLHLLA
jgi:hypothetical protein